MDDLPSRLSASAGAAAAAAEVVAAAAIAATAEAAAAEVTSAATFRLRTRLVDHQLPTLHLVLVKLLDRFLRRVIGGHLDETEAPRAAGRHVTHHARAGDIANAAEELVQILVCRFVWEITDVEPATHG